MAKAGANIVFKIESTNGLFKKNNSLSALFFGV